MIERSWIGLAIVLVLGPMLAWMPGSVMAAPTTVLQDGFETGAFSGWSTVVAGGSGSVAVQQSAVASGAYAARFTSTTSASAFAMARKDTGVPVSGLTVAASVNVLGDGAINSNVPLIRLFDEAGARVVSLYRQNATQDFLYVSYNGLFVKTASQLALNQWARAELSVKGAGTATATIEARLNGAVIFQVSGVTLGVGGIKLAQFGNEVKAQAFDLAVDDVLMTSEAAAEPSPSASLAPSPSVGPSAQPSTSPVPEPSVSSPPAPSVSAAPTPSPPPSDTTPPDTTLTSTPPPTTSSTSASFSFVSTEVGTFECRLDQGAFADCVSPTEYVGLAIGSHAFAVRAVDPAGNVDASPATWSWSIGSSNGCSATAPAPSNTDPGTVTLADNFEGGLGQWSKVSMQGDAEIAIESDRVRTGLCAVRTKVTSVTWDSRGNLQKNLPAGTGEVWLTGWFFYERELADQGWNLPTFRLFSDGKRVMDLSRQNVTGNVFLRYPNGTGGWSYIQTGRRFDMNRWYQVKIHARANGNLSTAEIWIDGVRYINSSAITLGQWTFDTVYLGAEHQNQEGDVVSDDVVIKTIVPPPTSTIFRDDWESGGFGAWTTVQVGGDGSAAAETGIVQSGSYAGRLTASSASGSLAYARQTLLSAENDVSVGADVLVAAEGAAGGSVPLVTLLDAGGVARVTLSRLNQNSNRLVVTHSGGTQSLTPTLALNVWARIEVRAVERGATPDVVEVRVNGLLAYRSETANTGVSGIKTVQIGSTAVAKAYSLIIDNLAVDRGTSGLTNDPRYKLLVADYLNKRLLITDFEGRVVWTWNNPTGRTDYTAGPIGVRWMPGNRILATFGTGEVGLLDVATRTWVWKVWGFNGDNFNSPYDAELLPDGNLAVALRFNNGGRISVYNLATGQEVWKHYLSNAHSVRFRTAAQSYLSDDPTLLVGGWGSVREVAYRLNGGQNVTWQVKTEYTHDAVVLADDRLLTIEGYYIQKIDRQGTRIWKRNTPDEDRRVAFDPNVNGGYVFTVAESDRIEFRDAEGNLLRDWSALSDGTSLDYPYGVQVIDYAG